MSISKRFSVALLVAAMLAAGLALLPAPKASAASPTCLPGSDVFVGHDTAGSGTGTYYPWADAANWTLGSVPGSGTDACIQGITTYPVQMSGGTTVNSLAVLGGSTLWVFTNNVFVNGNVLVDSTSTMAFDPYNSLSMTVGGTFTNYGNVQDGGTISGSGWGPDSLACQTGYCGWLNLVTAKLDNEAADPGNGEPTGGTLAVYNGGNELALSESAGGSGITNYNDITAHSGSTVLIGGNTELTQTAGTITIGNGAQFGTNPPSGGNGTGHVTLHLAGGTVTGGYIVYTSNGTVAFPPGSTMSGAVDFVGGGATLSGDVPSGMTVALGVQIATGNVTGWGGLDPAS